MVPVWRELLADLITPVAAFARLTRDDEPGFLLESVEHGERWSRWSFVGRRPAATLIARGDGRVEVTGGRLPAGIPTRPGHPRRSRGSARALPVAARPGPSAAARRPGRATSATTSCARSSGCPTSRRDDQGLPEAVLSIIGELAAFDHWRQRVTLISNAYVFGEPTDDGPRPPLRRSGRTGGAARDRRRLAVGRAVRRAAGARTSRCRTSDPRSGRPRSPPRSRRPASTSWPVTSSRSCLSQRFDVDLDADPFDAYRVLRQVNPSPYMYMFRHPEVSLVGASPETMVQLRDGKVISRPIAGTRYRGRTEEDDRRLGCRADRAPEGDRRAHHAGRPGPQRRRSRRAASAPRRSTR